MTLSELPAYLASHGCQLNNLFQLPSGVWRANVRRDNLLYAYGEANSPWDAIQAAITAGDPKPPRQSKPLIPSFDIDLPPLNLSLGDL